MINDINLKEVPQSSGVYLLVSNNQIIYVGSSNNLKRRLEYHNICIKNGSNNGCQKDLYKFLQSNPFTVEFQLSTNYKEKEQKLIEEYNPIFNKRRASAGIVNKENYLKEWQTKYHDEFLDYKNKYNNQMCNYKNKEITLNALVQHFFRKGLEHPTIEAKKYLIK